MGLFKKKPEPVPAPQPILGPITVEVTTFSGRTNTHTCANIRISDTGNLILFNVQPGDVACYVEAAWAFYEIVTEKPSEQAS